MVVVMYVERATITPKVINKIKMASEWFSEIEEELLEVDISSNSKLQGAIFEETQQSELPLFYENHIQPIGDIEKLHQWFLNYKLTHNTNELNDVANTFQVMGGEDEFEIVDPVPMGYVGEALDKMEGLMRGTAHWLSPSHWFSWGGESHAMPSNEFPVVQTNWYWRQQHRILRLTDVAIERVHPMTKQVRSSRPYPTLTGLVVTNGVFLNFTFLEELLNVVHEYYQIAPTHTDTVVEILQAKLPELSVRFESEDV